MNTVQIVTEINEEPMDQLLIIDRKFSIASQKLGGHLQTFTSRNSGKTKEENYSISKDCIRRRDNV